MQAERDALLELIAIFSHDLSNPLQSLTVLCELALDEARPGSEEEQRSKQCLEATERMRALIHGLSGATRRADGPKHVDAVAKRVFGLLQRRFDRHNIALMVDVSAIQGVTPPGECEFALLNLGLAVVAAAADARQTSCSVQVRGMDGASTDRPYSIEIHAQSADGEAKSLPLSPLHLQRVEELLGSCTRAGLVRQGPRARIEFEAI